MSNIDAKNTRNLILVLKISNKVGEVLLIDPNSPVHYQRVITVVNNDKTFFDMELVLYNLHKDELSGADQNAETF